MMVLPGGHSLRLYTNEAMVENLALYPRLGFRDDERRAEHGLRRVYYSKRLGMIWRRRASVV
jgi:hypothetical protein